MIRLCITSDGRVQGLWDDSLDLPALGPVRVRRASHIEFCPRRQTWYVQVARPRAWWRRLLQLALRRPWGEVMHWARTRGEVLEWEQGHLAAR